jgi:putative tricarboxylic transport membrane protein
MFESEIIQSALKILFSPTVLAFLILGFSIGFIVGAVPGFNDANLMAIMLPFTLLLKPEVAVIAMMAIYGAAQAAGSIPAILMNIPGTPGNAATTIEGYALAKQGKAGFALGLSFGASAVGAMIGAILAFGLAPVLGLFALEFGASEMFLLAVLGLTVVSSLSGGNMAKGLLVAGFGVLLSLIGADSMAGFPRGTYSIHYLYDGLPLIPVLLGLFAIPELVQMIRRSSIADQSLGRAGWSEIWKGAKTGLGLTRTQGVNLGRSSVLGYFIGVIPGAGATIGSFLAYGQARQWSRKKEQFGKGSEEGLVATDSANNATAAGALVPTLTLGLPGSASTLIMLACLYLHGVRPGPTFFNEFKVEAYAILLSLFLLPFLLLSLGFVFAKYAQRVVFIPSAFLIPIVTVLVFIGAYAWRFHEFDIVLMLIFGAIGLLMKNGGYPIPAFLLAIILGPMVESEFLRAVRIDGYTAFFQTNMSLVLVFTIVLSLCAPLILKVFRRSA